MDTFEPGQEPAATESSIDSFASRLDQDIAAGNSQQTEAAPATTPAPNQDAPAEFSGHPAWKPFEEALGPVHYRTIEPHLRSMNQAFESKIASTNKALEPWKQFIDQQIDPQFLSHAYSVGKRIEAEPLAVFRELEQYLRSTGQLEAAKEVAQAAAAAEGAEGADPDEDPRVAQLQAQIEQLTQGQQQFMQFQQERLQQEQFQQEVQKVEQSLEQEVQALKTQGADDRLIAAVLDRAELLYHRTGKAVPLTEIATQIRGEQDVIRNQPRPVDRAPRLPGVTGGAPQQGTVDLSAATRSQSVDTLAAMLQAAKG